MESSSIAFYRLAQQRLSANAFQTPVEVVGWMGAVQAQDYPGGRWAVGQRIQAATDQSIEQAFNEGQILRTHTMRTTWHFVLPTDIRWMLELTAPRQHAGSQYRYRQIGLGEAELQRSLEVIARAFEQKPFLMRAEIAAALEAAGIPTAKDNRLSHILGHAEINLLICSGPRQGKQFTYALFTERAPQANSLPREAALAEFTRRYFTSHGPATIRDFTWWTGLTAVDARQGIAGCADALAHQTIDGQEYWFAVDLPDEVERCPSAFLLPTYDELVVGYAGFGKNRVGEQDASQFGNFDGTLFIAGKVAGSWKRTLKKDSVLVEISMGGKLSSVEQDALDRAVEEYSRFMELPVEVSFKI